MNQCCLDLAKLSLIHEQLLLHLRNFRLYCRGTTALEGTYSILEGLRHLKWETKNKWIGSTGKEGKMKRNMGRKDFLREEHLCSCGGRSRTLYSPGWCCSLGGFCWALDTSAWKKKKKKRRREKSDCKGAIIKPFLSVLKMMRKKVIGCIVLYNKKLILKRRKTFRKHCQLNSTVNDEGCRAIYLVL